MKVPSLQTKIGDIVRECYPGGSMSPPCWHVFAFDIDTGEAYVGAVGAPAASWFRLRSWVRTVQSKPLILFKGRNLGKTVAREAFREWRKIFAS